MSKFKKKHRNEKWLTLNRHAPELSKGEHAATNYTNLKGCYYSLWLSSFISASYLTPKLHSERNNEQWFLKRSENTLKTELTDLTYHCSVQSRTGKRSKLGFESHISNCRNCLCISSRLNSSGITFCFWSKLWRHLRIPLSEDHTQVNGLDIWQKMWLIRHTVFVVNTRTNQEKEKGRSTESTGNGGISCALLLRSQQIAMLI